jgi:opacity protein-like surface antigen
MKSFLAVIFITLAALDLVAQDDLMDLVDKETQQESNYIEQTFKGTRLINGHSIETRKKGVLDVIISHRFGRLNSGAYELFGLDESNVRLGVDYGITDRLNAGVGRNSFEKTYDGFLKYKIIRQQNGNERNVPVSVVGFSSIALKTLRSGDPAGEPDFNSRLTYSYQLIVAKKFSPSFSFQISPTLVHRNAVVEEQDANDIYALGAGGRIKLNKRISLNAEYYYQFNRAENSVIQNSVAIGFDIETGGHVFQLHFTNSRAMIEKGFITETTGDFFEGDIHFGFNISRTFQLY